MSELLGSNFIYFPIGQVPQTVGSKFSTTRGIGELAHLSSSFPDFGLIDEDTPKSAYSIVSDEGPTWDLVFSDEFEQEGRTFYPGGATHHDSWLLTSRCTDDVSIL